MTVKRLLKAISFLLSRNAENRQRAKIALRIDFRWLCGGNVRLSKSDLDLLGEGRKFSIHVYSPWRDGKEINLDKWCMQVLKRNNFID